MTSVETEISQVSGVVGVSAKHLETGHEIRHNADVAFFTAITFKVPVLVELYRQIDEGKINPNARVELTNDMRAPGGGVLKELGAGLQPTVHDLAVLMIINSDNTATDILYEKVGREKLNNTILELGLTSTRIPMNTREILFSTVGLDPYKPTHTYQLASDKLFLEQWEEGSDAFSEEKTDVSSPGDMSRLFEMLHKGEVLSRASSEAVMDILLRQQLNNVIPLILPPGTQVAHKTGSYHNVRCDVGIVYSPNGPYTVAIMAKRLIGYRLSIDASLGAVSRAIYDEFTRDPDNISRVC